MTATATHHLVRIRTYRPGDEVAQVGIYNAAAANLAGFKPATADEVSRRYRAADFDPTTKLYAESAGRVVGYVTFWANGRVSLPWLLPDAADVSDDLLQAAITAMRARGIRRAWAAYRADWTIVRERLEAAGFRLHHEVVNFVAELAQLPTGAAPSHLQVSPLGRDAAAVVFALDPGAFGVASADELSAAWWDGPYLASDSFFALGRRDQNCIVAAGVAVINSAYADPTKIDAAMPCFRLGAIGAEGERMKRVNGLFSYVARPSAESREYGQHLLSEACRRFARAGIAHVAAQCRSDRDEFGFYDLHFQRQRSFPVFVREL